MNIQKFWTSTVERIVIDSRCSHADAWRAAAKTYPDAAILMRATGQTRQMVQFFNSRLGTNPEQLAASRREFLNEVDTQMKRTGVSHNVAFFSVSNRKPQGLKSVRITYPGQKSSRPEFANAGTSFVGEKMDGANQGANGVPVASPQLKALFRMPQSITDDTWAAAWAGNGNVASPVNFGRIFDAVCELVQKKTGSDYETALRDTKIVLPDLWAAVDQLSQLTRMS